MESKELKQSDKQKSKIDAKKAWKIFIIIFILVSVYGFMHWGSTNNGSILICGILGLIIGKIGLWYSRD